jgi:hypothetical protein
MYHLNWKRISYETGEYQIVAKDRMFLYRLQEKDGNSYIEAYHHRDHKGFTYKYLQLTMRKLDDLDWKGTPLPLVIIKLRGTGVAREDVLKKLSCLGNQIWIDNPEEMYKAIESWLDDYGYLKTLTKFNKEEF